MRKEVILQGNVLNFQQQVTMIRPFSAEDVRALVIEIQIAKSPGYDGYNSAFFKSSWDVIGPEVTCAVLEFFDKRKLLR